MTLRELLELLQSLSPSSALDARVTITDGTTDLDIHGARYANGEVAVIVDQMPVDRYAEGFDDGFDDGVVDGRERATKQSFHKAD